MAASKRMIGLLLLTVSACLGTRSTASAGENAGLSFPFPAGYERFHPYPVQFPNELVAGGTGWFAMNNMTLADINFWKSQGFRLFNIEVEHWAGKLGEVARFSGIFVENQGDYYADDWQVVIGTEQEVRDALNTNAAGVKDPGTPALIPYRVMDLEVKRFRDGKEVGPGIQQASSPIDNKNTEICALLVSNTGKQYVPYSEFIVYAGIIEASLWLDSHPCDVRLIDHEFSTDTNEDQAALPESTIFNMVSYIIAIDEGVNEIETKVISFETFSELNQLMDMGWQPIDIEHTPENQIAFLPGVWKKFSAICVKQKNEFEFFPALTSYTPNIWIVGPTSTPLDAGFDKRMIDLNLSKKGNSFLMDELYIDYE